MIPNYPYFGFPNYNKYFNQNQKSNYNMDKINPSNSSHNFKHASNLNNNAFTNNIFSSRTESKSHNESFETKSDFINIFGLSLGLDDILILCLLFFLYSEKSDDYILMLVLVLLLLT